MESNAGSTPELRDELISTAVRFLENERVAPSSADVKRAFLAKKGLTDAEIDAAFARARPPASAPTTSAASPMASTSPVVVMAPYGRLQRFRDIANFMALVCGAAYLAQYLWKHYIVHWLNGTRAKAVKSASVASLELQERVLGSIERLSATVEKMQSAFEEHTAKLSCLLDQNGGSSSGASDAVEDIKRDVQTVKGLLLSSTRFPSHPPVKTIPQWQLEAADKISTAEAKAVEVTTNGHKDEE